MSDKYGIDDKTRFLVLYLDAQMTPTKISRIINRSLYTLRHWVDWTKNGDDIRIEGRGRKKSITEDTENKIIQSLKENPEGTSTPKLAARFGISETSVARILAKKGYRYLGFKNVVEYSEEERSFRVEFCNKMLYDEGKLIYRTFFSDEMGIDLTKTRKNRAWQLPNQKIAKKSARANVKLECWGAISSQGATTLDIYKKSMNGEFYRQIIENHKAEMEQCYPDGEFYFIQDYHPVHRMNEDWIVKEQKMGLIKLPRKSPDLNIIEHLWLALKERVRNDEPRTESELKESLLRNWEILTQPERLQPFFENLHRRYVECVAREGHKLPG